MKLNKLLKNIFTGKLKGGQPDVLDVVPDNNELLVVQKPVINYNTDRRKAKLDAKKAVKKKFDIGGVYYLHWRSRDGSKPIVMGFRCVKTIYTKGTYPMNIVIMKQLSGPTGNKYTLNRNECRKLHIKFDLGLEVWPMGLNWIPENKNVAKA